jgi:hypothetical protein
MRPTTILHKPSPGIHIIKQSCTWQPQYYTTLHILLLRLTIILNHVPGSILSHNPATGNLNIAKFCSWDTILHFSWDPQYYTIPLLGSTILHNSDPGTLNFKSALCTFKMLQEQHQHQSFVPVSPSSDLIREIASGYPTNVYDCNRLLLLTLRQKMAQTCGMMFIDLPDGCCYGD